MGIYCTSLPLLELDLWALLTLFYEFEEILSESYYLDIFLAGLSLNILKELADIIDPWGLGIALKLYPDSDFWNFD